MAGQAQRQRKRNPYAKLPSPRLWHGSTFDVSTDRAPAWWKRFGYDEDTWPIAVEETRKQELRAMSASMRALFDHFEFAISDSADCWDLAPSVWRDIALSLAYRHEKELLVRGKQIICYSALYGKYGVDPDDFENADRELVFKLAAKYVWPEVDPQSEQLDDWGTRWSTPDLARIVRAILAVANVLKGRGKKASARAIADALQDKKALASIIPKKAADDVHALLLHHGNKVSLRKSPKSWLRKTLIPPVLYPPGKPTTPLQQQLYFAVLPLVCRARVGQIEDVSECHK